MRFPISLPIRCASWDSIPTRDSRIFLSLRRSATKRIAASVLPRAEARDEIRLLASRFRRVVAQRGKRKHGDELGLREKAGAAQRTDWLRSDADRRAESQRHQGRRSAFTGCVVHGRGAGRGDGANRVNGGGAPNVSSAGAAGEAGRQHRSDQQRPAYSERGLFVVGGRSAQVWRSLRAT